MRPLTFAALLDSREAVNANCGHTTRWHHGSAVFPASHIACSVKRDSSRQFLIVEEPRPIGVTPQSDLKSGNRLRRISMLANQRQQPVFNLSV